MLGVVGDRKAADKGCLGMYDTTREGETLLQNVHGSGKEVNPSSE